MTPSQKKSKPGKTLETLRAEIRERLENLAESQFQNGKRNAALKQLLALVQCELPTQTVQREVSSILREIVQENQVRGVSDDELRTHQDELVGLAQQSALDRVRGNFLLLRIAEKEKLEVTETDHADGCLRDGPALRDPGQKLVKDLQSREGFGPIREQILMGKALDLIASNVYGHRTAESAAKA